MRVFHSALAAVNGRDAIDPLKARVRGERQEVAELEAGAEHPESGVGEPEQPEGRQPDPVRRHEHADRPRAERGGQVVHETGFLGHQWIGRLLIGICSDSRSSVSGPGLVLGLGSQVGTNDQND